MDIVLKLIITKEYKELDNYLKNFNDNSKHDIIKLIYFLLNNIENNFFSDETFTFILTLFLKHFKNLHYTEYFDDIIKVLKSNKYNKSVRLLENHKNLTNTKIYLLKFLNKCKRSNGDIKNYLKNDNIIELSFTSILNKMRNVINYYYNEDYIKTLKISDELLKEKNIEKNTYRNVQIIRMKNKLLEVVNFFGIELLCFMNVKVITNLEYIQYSYDDKIKYYEDCMKRINSTIVSYYKMFTLYKHIKSSINNILLDEQNIKVNRKYVTNLSIALNDFMKN